MEKIVLNADKLYNADFGFVAEYKDTGTAEKDFGIDFSANYSRVKLSGVETVNNKTVTADGVKIDYLSKTLRGTADEPAKYAMVIVKCFDSKKGNDDSAKQ